MAAVCGAFLHSSTQNYVPAIPAQTGLSPYLQITLKPNKQHQRLRLFQDRGRALSVTPAASYSSSSTVAGGPSLDTTTVLDLSGNSRNLTSLWEERRVVIGFARHFGCVLCRKRADLLASKKEAMDAAGVALVLIGPGNVDQAQAFVSQTNFPGEVYADPTHSAFDAFQFVSGASTIFNPKAAMRVVSALMEGYRQDWGLSFQKDTRERGGWQQGGVVVAGPGKDRLLYIHKDKEAGDEPGINEVLAACCN